MTDLIQIRGGTYPILNYLNIVYAEREIVLELDTGRFKVGDGATPYIELEYQLVDFILNFVADRYALTADAAPRYPRISSRTSAAPLTVNVDNYEGVTVSAQNAALAIDPLTGSPQSGQTFRFRIKDDGTARTITWDSVFRAIGVTLPVTTVAGKTVYIDAVWNSQDTKWDCVRVAQQA